MIYEIRNQMERFFSQGIFSGANFSKSGDAIKETQFKRKLERLWELDEI